MSWCRIRRASLAALRRERRARGASRARPLPARLARDRPAGDAGGKNSFRSRHCRYLPRWESEVLPRRVPNYALAQLDQLCASELVRPAPASTASRSSSARTPAALGFTDGAESPEGEIHDRIRETLGRSAQFWFDLVDEVGIDPAELLPALGARLGLRGRTTPGRPLRAGRRHGVLGRSDALGASPVAARRRSRRRA